MIYITTNEKYDNDGKVLLFYYKQEIHIGS